MPRIPRGSGPWRVPDWSRVRTKSMGCVRARPATPETHPAKKSSMAPRVVACPDEESHVSAGVHVCSVPPPKSQKHPGIPPPTLQPLTPKGPPTHTRRPMTYDPKNRIRQAASAPPHSRSTPYMLETVSGGYRYSEIQCFQLSYRNIAETVPSNSARNSEPRNRCHVIVTAPPQGTWRTRRAWMIEFPQGTPGIPQCASCPS